LKEYAVEGLKKEWSPDVIAGKLKQEKINNRPRKCLNYLSSNEVINQVVH